VCTVFDSSSTEIASSKEYNIKIDLKEMGCDGVDWIGVAQDRV
jgi:hypothetical protein